VPAAAVIPAPIAYIKVVAVKKLVVEFWAWFCGLPTGMYCATGLHFLGIQSALHWVGWRSKTFTLKKLECSKQAYA
jgi:hypothetical protein